MPLDGVSFTVTLQKQHPPPLPLRAARLWFHVKRTSGSIGGLESERSI